MTDPRYEGYVQNQTKEYAAFGYEDPEGLARRESPAMIAEDQFWDRKFNELGR